MKIQITKMFGTTLYTAAMAAVLGLPAAASQSPAAALQLQPKIAAERAEATKEGRDTGAVKPRESARSLGSMAYKWPAMANSPQGNKPVVQARR